MGAIRVDGNPLRDHAARLSQLAGDLEGGFAQAHGSIQAAASGAGHPAAVGAAESFRAKLTQVMAAHIVIHRAMAAHLQASIDDYVGTDENSANAMTSLEAR